MSELSTTNSQPARTVEAVTLEIQTLQRQAQQLLLGYADVYKRQQMRRASWSTACLTCWTS